MSANRGQRAIARFAYLPEEEFALAREQGLLDPTVQLRHEDYRREVEQALRGYARHDGLSVVVMPLDVSGLVAYAASEGKDPASRQTRMSYNLSLPDERGIGWPPPRNGHCWCGSGRKYKQCCGAPAFWSRPVPDPATFVLRIELQDVQPSVWRRVLVPSNTRLDHLHRVIQSAMGWGGDHLYLFEKDGTVLGPNDFDVVDEMDRVIAVASEVGERFDYMYDMGDSWWHSVTIEEVRPSSPDARPVLLDGGGTCPPEDCGGAGRYMAMVAALDDPSDPLHEEALDLLTVADHASDRR